MRDSEFEELSLRWIEYAKKKKQADEAFEQKCMWFFWLYMLILACVFAWKYGG